jgi:UDP-glucose-4-epimerase GalE
MCEINKKILVTGGAGYIGSHTCRELQRQGYEPIVFDNLENGYQENVLWGPLFKGDLRKAEQLEACFETFKPAAVIHFAAYAYVGESVNEPEKYYENNVIGSFNLLKTMKKFGVNKLVFSSSCATYGIPENMPIAETELQKPVNPYGNTKLQMERMMQDFSEAYGLKFVALRYFNAAGASPDSEIGENHVPETHLIPLILAAVAGKISEVSVYGSNYPTPDGTCIRDYIHVCDLADAHIKALEYLEESNRKLAFNLGTGTGNSVMEVIKAVEKVVNKPVPYKITDRRAGDPAVLVSKTGLAEKKLRWSPQYNEIETIVEHAWNYYKKINQID